MENNTSEQKETVILKLGNNFEALFSIIDNNFNEGKDAAALFMLARIKAPFIKIFTDLHKRGILTSSELIMIKNYISRIVAYKRELIQSKERIRLLESNEANRYFNQELQEVQDMYNFMMRDTH